MTEPGTHTHDLFEGYLTRWSLAPDGKPIVTPRAQLLPVRQNGQPAMLKVATEPEEMFGALLMAWWDGDGAARVLAHEGPALLLERATSGRTLSELVRSGRDDEASRIMCRLIERLHAPRPRPLPELVPLTHWFRDLTEFSQDGLLARARTQALALAGRAAAVDRAARRHPPRQHSRLRRARVAGDRSQTADRRPLFRLHEPVLQSRSRCRRRTPSSSRDASQWRVETAGLDRKRLLQWILAWTGLSAVWCLNDMESIDVTDKDRLDIDLKVAALAAAELDR